uniref:F-box domain-containing protein n=1 Tax=Graphocephala atropunctata TaxID=36148 RepID=A0A1B6LU86_9HEMI
MTLPENEEYQSESPPAKKLKREESPQPSTSSTTSTCREDEDSLLNFCDDLMLEIFSHVKPTDLLALSLCCKRLDRIVRDRTLWTNVDFRPMCLDDSELRKYTKFFLPSTKVIAIKGSWLPPPSVVRIGERHVVVPCSPEDPNSTGNKKKETLSLSVEFLESLAYSAPNLLTLIIENHVLDSQNLSWNKVPRKLEHLSLQRCHLVELDLTKSFFFGIDRALPGLQTLDLSECYWFESHSLLALSKCEKLEKLILTDCLLSDFVPYVSLGTRFGFKALTVIDFRRTWVSDREVSCLNRTPNLRELYLESPGGERGATLISDMAVTAFGATQEVWNQLGYFVLLMPDFGKEGFLPSPLRVIQLHKYVTVTDTSLRHCASCLKGLEKLDVRGTSCSQTGVIEFKSQRPDVIIESDFQLEVEVEAVAGSNVDNT